MTKIDSGKDIHLNLRGVPCPLNFVRCKLALEDLSLDSKLQIDLDQGEPFDTIVPALEKEGCIINIISKESDWVRLMVKLIGS